VGHVTIPYITQDDLVKCIVAEKMGK